jgi:hypothetical protein
MILGRQKTANLDGAAFFILSAMFIEAVNYMIYAGPMQGL